MQIQGISAAVFGSAADPKGVDAAHAANAAEQELGTLNQQAAATSVPPHATVTIYNAKAQPHQVGAVPGAPRER